MNYPRLEILFSLTQDTMARRHLMALKGDDYKTERARTSQRARTSAPQGVSDHSRIQRETRPFL